MRGFAKGDAPWHKREIRPERVMALGFLALIVLGGLLLSLPIAAYGRRSVGMLDAFFTATSAVCVTGLVTLDIAAAFSAFGKTVIILLIQIGGLGFMVFATLVMVALGRRISLRNRMLIRESLNTASFSGLVRLTLWYSALALMIELLGAALLSVRFIPMLGAKKGVLYSLFHSISAFCNAGFDLFGNFESLTAFKSDPLVLLTVAALLILGGLGFYVMNECLTHRRDPRGLSLHTKLVLSVTGGLLLLGTIAFLLLEGGNPDTLGESGMGLGDRLLGAFFESATLRTAGFAAFEQARLTDASKLISLLFMFIGASPASTGGGVKTTTISVVIMLVISVVRGAEDVNLHGRRLPTSTIRRALAVLFISIGMVLVSMCALAISERNSGRGMIDLMFEAVSAFATVGVSSVNTPSLRPLSHMLLMPLMFFGRVGPLTIAYALAARAEGAGSRHVRYPEEKLMIG